MRRAADVWREQLKLWLPALVFCLLNVAAFATYRLVFSEQAQVGQGWVARDSAELESLTRQRARLERLVASATENRARIDQLYERWLTPERQRLTRVIAEVKELANRAGLQPSSLTYPEEDLEDYGLVKRSIVFTVEGTYLALRRLVNFLEISDYFLTLDEVGLAEGTPGSARLRIDLKISTLFVEEERAGREPAAAAEVSS